MIKGVTQVNHAVTDPHSLFGFGLDVASITQRGEAGVTVTFTNLALPQSKYGGRGTYDKVVLVTKTGGPQHALSLPTQPEFGSMEARSYDVDLTQLLDGPGTFTVVVETRIGTGEKSSSRTVALSVASV